MSDGMKKCPKCGTINLEYAEVCDCKYNFSLVPGTSTVHVSKRNLLKSFFMVIIISIPISACNMGLFFLCIYAYSNIDSNIFQNLFSYILFLIVFVIMISCSVVFITKKLFKNKYHLSIPFSFVLGFFYTGIYISHNNSRILKANEGIMSAYSHSLDMYFTAILFAIYCFSGCIAYCVIKSKK